MDLMGSLSLSTETAISSLLTLISKSSHCRSLLLPLLALPESYPFSLTNVSDQMCKNGEGKECEEEGPIYKTGQKGLNNRKIKERVRWKGRKTNKGTIGFQGFNIQNTNYKVNLTDTVFTVWPNSNNGNVLSVLSIG